MFLSVPPSESVSVGPSPVDIAESLVGLVALAVALIHIGVMVLTGLPTGRKFLSEKWGIDDRGRIILITCAVEIGVMAVAAKLWLDEQSREPDKEWTAPNIAAFVVITAALSTCAIRVAFSLKRIPAWNDIAAFRSVHLPERTLMFGYLLTVGFGAAIAVWNEFAEAKRGGAGVVALNGLSESPFMGWLAALIFYSPVQQAFVDSFGLLRAHADGQGTDDGESQTH